MPELPEVQTVCSVIGPQITEKRIQDVRIYGAHVLSCDLHRFEENVRGQCFKALDRRGKYLIFSLESGKQLVMHLHDGLSVGYAGGGCCRKAHTGCVHA